eukprot:s2986_g9.t1
MWSTTRQPFPTQSTAESELVSLCEALVGGRATASLVAAVRAEKEEDLIKRLWGDNAASIALATGEGQGSWRTRHLRIRAAILRNALQQNEWHLGHLKGSELVADSFTKIVLGPAFERALQDLGVMTEVKKMQGSGGGCFSQEGARVAMLVGATLVSNAAAAEDVEKGEGELSWPWTLGLILMCVGAVYVGRAVARSGLWICKRLLGASGGQKSGEATETESEGQGSWRTRHLRIRAAILRNALQQNEWHLGLLKGSELVADSFTKIVLGPAFEKALQDLGVVTEVKKMQGSGGGCFSQEGARVAMLVGATLVSNAAAAEDVEKGEGELSWPWTLGLILMCVGAVCVGRAVARSGLWICKRLLGASGGQKSGEATETESCWQSSSPKWSLDLQTTVGCIGRPKVW